jgi:hypothetical protein
VLFRVLALAAVASAFIFVTRPASADSTGFAVTRVKDNIQVKSDGSAASTREIENVTVANNGDYADKITSFTLDGITYLDGNPDDKVIGVSFDDDTKQYDKNHAGATNCYVNEPLNPGGVCNLELTLQFSGVAPVPGGSNGTDLSYGEDAIKVTVNAQATEIEVEEVAGDPPVKGSAIFNAHVDYDGPDATPEPSSLLFLGTGMLGLAGVVRRKLGRG